MHSTTQRLRCKAFVLLALCLLVQLKGTAQVLDLGSTCPDIKVKNVLNNKNGTLQLSQLKNKSILIIFWNIRCLSCLREFPKFDSLQEKFNEELQLIVVTKDDSKSVEQLFKKHPKARLTTVPMVTEDKAFSPLFPVDGYPFIVWLDAKKNVRYITGGNSITTAHIQDFISNKPLDLNYAAVKTKYGSLWTHNLPGIQSKLLYYSYLSPCIEGVDIGNASGSTNDQETSSQIACNCCSILDLLKKAFGENEKFNLNTSYALELIIKDSSRYFLPSNEDQWQDWQRKHTYNYELSLPVQKKDSLYAIMQQDLTRFFNLSVTRVTKRIKGYALITLGDCSAFKTKGGPPRDSYNDFNPPESPMLYFTNQPFNRLTYLLGYWLGYKYPFENWVHFEGNMDIVISKKAVSTMDVGKLRRELKKYNLDLIETEFERPVFRIQEN